MKAAQIVNTGKVDILEIADPEIVKGNEVIIRLSALGLCGSDLNTYRGRNPLAAFPRIPGHEIAGEIVELGSECSSNFTKGQQVTVWPYTYCGSCTSCRKQKHHCCKYNQTYGVQRDGAAQEYLSVPEEFLIDSDNLSIELTALIEPMSVGWHAATRGAASTGSRVAVFGCGLIGLGVIAACKQMGSEVIAIDIEGKKLAKAAELGADYLINSAEEDLAGRIDTITGGNGSDISIEAVGNPVTFRQAVEIAAYSGRVVYIGYAKEEVTYNSNDFVKKEIEIFGSRNATMEDFKNVKNLVSKNPKICSSLITQEYPLAKTDEAFRFWSESPRDVTKILIRF
jgi:L-galactonate 5-dehydrogenase